MFTIFNHNLMNNLNFDFLNSGSYIMDGIISLNDHILFYEIIILMIVIWTLLSTIYYTNSFILKDFYHGSILEIFWTLLPGIILILIALPSFRLLYLMDDFSENNLLTIKVIGNQWYWSYNYNDADSINEFDSYMAIDANASDDSYKGFFRLLDTDSYLILPSNTPIKFLITSTDVIHSWGIPSLGIKMDACPGRLNQVGIEIYKPGLYFGQCYELCGINHAFMPITVKVV